MPVAETSAIEAGDATGGFYVSAAAPAFRLRVWGYWAPDVVAAFAREVPAACQRLTAAAELLVDADELKPQGADGQEALRVWFRGLATLTFAKGNVVASNALTRMQLTRLMRECGVFERLSFVAKVI